METHAVPGLPVFIGLCHAALGIAIGPVVRQQEVLVLADEPLVEVLVADAVPETLPQGIQAPLHLGIVADIALGHIALPLQCSSLIGMEAEEEHVLIAQHIVHLHVGAVQSTHGEGTVHHELHVAGAAGLLAGGGDLLAHLAGGHQLLRQRDPVVLQKHHLQLIAADRVVVDLIRQGVDEADDPLGHCIPRRRLGAEQERVGLRDGVGVVLELLVQCDDVQHVQKLPLILVEPLHLNVEDGVRVQLHAPGLLGMGGEGRLAGPLDGTQPLQNRGVIGIVIQLFQGLGVQQIVVPAGQVPDQAVQSGVDLTEPAAVVNAVGDVPEFPGLHAVGVPENVLFQDLGV